MSAKVLSKWRKNFVTKFFDQGLPIKPKRTFLCGKLSVILMILWMIEKDPADVTCPYFGELSLFEGCSSGEKRRVIKSVFVRY